jgi:serine/threonine protein kinase
MTSISDRTVQHLRLVAEAPDFRGTRYQIGRVLARGGMGVVYEAQDQELQRSIAIKVLATELVSSHDVERMRREARIVAGLEHPGIVPLHDFGVLPDGRAFYAMKLVRGVTLDAFAARTSGTTELLRLFLRICEAVAFAHARGIVHCDLKPDNIMVGEFGEALVMDWGVAAGLGEPARGLAGTRGFMPPEQERGETLDATADVFALGTILRRMLEGSGQSVSRRLKAIYGKAAAAVRSDRYRNAGELADDVARFLDDRPLTAYRENGIERLGRWLDRNRALVAVVLAYLVMRAIILLIVHR